MNLQQRFPHLAMSTAACHCALGLLVCCLWLALAPPTAGAADRKLAIDEFYVYPDDRSDQHELTGFVYPENGQLSAVVSVTLSGYNKEEKLDLYLVLFDPDGRVLVKKKGKHSLPAGTHDLVFPDFFATTGVFGQQQCRLELEATLKGTKPVKVKREVTLIGPDPPDIDILSLTLYNPEWGRQSNDLAPGCEFTLELEVDIEDNYSTIAPQLKLYGVVEEDGRETDPNYDSQPYDANWDVVNLPSGNGVFRIVAQGQMPYYFAQPWENRHPVRIYAIVDCGGGVRKEDYVRKDVIDAQPSNARQADDINARLIQLNRAYRWEIKRLRGGAPEPPHRER